MIIPKSLPHPPVLHDSEAPWCHTVDTPVRDPLVVADGDGEAAVVGPHHADHVARPRAPDVHAVPLARVLSQVRVAAAGALREVGRRRHSEQREVEVCKKIEKLEQLVNHP